MYKFIFYTNKLKYKYILINSYFIYLLDVWNEYNFLLVNDIEIVKDD